MNLTQEIVKELLDYNPETGKLHWKKRDIKWFKASEKRSARHICNHWNSKNAGKEALNFKRKDGYFSGNIFSKQYLAHRVIWLLVAGEWPDEIDHVNWIRGDNRWNNLREVDKITNLRNQRLRKNNTSGVSGVSFDKRLNKWCARIQKEGKEVYLGIFDTIEEAKGVRKQAEKGDGYHSNHGKRVEDVQV